MCSATGERTRGTESGPKSINMADESRHQDTKSTKIAGTVRWLNKDITTRQLSIQNNAHLYRLIM
jgi:hypothetical protein